MPKVNPVQEMKNNQPTDEFLKLLTSTQDVSQAQDLLARSAHDANASLREISDIPPPKQSDNGLKLGFDYDTFKDIVLTGVGIGAGAATTGVGAMSIPALTVGTLAVAGLGGLAKGTYDETNAAREQFATSPEVDLSALETSLKGIDEKIQGVQQAMQDKAAIDFSELVTPLNAIDEKTQLILQAMQDEQPHEADRLQELFGTLPNIEEYTKSILLELQDKAATDLSELVTPLTAIDESGDAISLVCLFSEANFNQLLTLWENREPVSFTDTAGKVHDNLIIVMKEYERDKNFPKYITATFELWKNASPYG